MPIILLLVWIVLNGHLSGEVLLFGVPVCVLLSFFCHRIMGYSLGSDRFFLRHLGRELRYFTHLVYEIIHAALVIIRIVYSKNAAVEPRLIYFKSGLRTAAARSILANSITLTAGTITVQVTGDSFCVHSLDESLARGIEDSSFAQELRQMED